MIGMPVENSAKRMSLLPLSRLEEKVVKSPKDVGSFIHEVKHVSNECNKKLGAGAYGEAWKVCSACTDGTCSACVDCKVAKFPIGDHEIDTEEVVIHRKIMAAAEKAPYKAPKRHIYALKGIETSPSGAGIIPFTELIEPKQILTGLKVSNVDDLINAWSKDHALVTDAEWRSINLQLFGTIAGLRTQIPNFKHNDCHYQNVMLTEWPDDTSQKYAGRTSTLMLPPQRFCVKLIDYGQVTSNDSTCSTKEGRELWYKWLDVGVIDLTRFSFLILDAVITAFNSGHSVPPALITWGEFVLRQLRPEEYEVVSPPGAAAERLFALTDAIRSVGVSEYYLHSIKMWSMADILEDPYFDMFRLTE